MEINENDARGGADCHDSGYHGGGDCRDGSIDVGQDERMREILDYYRGLPERSSQETIVELLRELQEVYGCISPFVLEQAAEAAGVRESMIQAICKRYPSLKTAPYAHEIVLCTGRNCAAKGSLAVLDELKKRLGVGKSGISEDGAVCLRTRNCLKNCRKAPNVMVDGRMCSGLDAEGILRELKHR
jgi:NADH-quinone oxidoreductase subunit E